MNKLRLSLALPPAPDTPLVSQPLPLPLPAQPTTNPNLNGSCKKEACRTRRSVVEERASMLRNLSLDDSIPTLSYENQGQYGSYYYDEVHQKGIKIARLPEGRTFQDIKRAWDTLRLQMYARKVDDATRRMFVLPENPSMCVIDDTEYLTYEMRHVFPISYNNLTDSQQQAVKEQLASGIKWLVSNGIYHNDLHARNVMIELWNGIPEARIIDWDLITTGGIQMSADSQCKFYDYSPSDINGCVEELLVPRPLSTSAMTSPITPSPQYGGKRKPKNSIKVGNRRVYFGARGGMYLRTKNGMERIKKIK